MYKIVLQSDYDGNGELIAEVERVSDFSPVIEADWRGYCSNDKKRLCDKHFYYELSKDEEIFDRVMVEDM